MFSLRHVLVTRVVKVLSSLRTLANTLTTSFAWPSHDSLDTGVLLAATFGPAGRAASSHQGSEALRSVLDNPLWNHDSL